MNVGIIGLGLIGGSLAKAYKKAGMKVYAFDIDASVLQFARISGAADEALTDETLQACGLVLIALPPDAAVQWLEENAAKISAQTLVMDCCGVKRRICAVGFPLSEKYGFTFVGGHPMAGTHKWGFANSRADLFEGACFVAVPRAYDDMTLFERVKESVLPAGFGSVSVTTAERHDRLIAFTSQLAHVVSNAYIKSGTALDHKGFSAGSYQDLTRVAWLNPDMWTELFLDNKDNLIYELDTVITSLSEYRDACARGDAETLRALLDAGSKRKKEVDGR